MCKLFSILAVFFLFIGTANAAAPTFTSGVNYEYSGTVPWGIADTLSGLDTVSAVVLWPVTGKAETILSHPALVGASKDTSVIALHIYRYDEKANLISETVTDTLTSAGEFITIPYYGEAFITAKLINRTGAGTKVRCTSMRFKGRSAVTLMREITQ